MLPPVFVVAGLQRPVMAFPQRLKVLVQRWRKSSGEKSGWLRGSIQTPSAKPISQPRATPRASK